MEKTVRRQAPIVASRRAPGKGGGAPAIKTGDPAVAAKTGDPAAAAKAGDPAAATKAGGPPRTVAAPAQGKKPSPAGKLDSWQKNRYRGNFFHLQSRNAARAGQVPAPRRRRIARGKRPCRKPC